MMPVFLAHGPNLLVAIPIAAAWACCLYGSPIFASWLVRRKKKSAALIVSAIGIALSAYATVAGFPDDAIEALLWLAIGLIPLVAASAAFFAASRIKSPIDENA